MYIQKYFMFFVYKKKFIKYVIYINEKKNIYSI